MKNKLIAKSLLTIAAIGITTTTIASTADAAKDQVQEKRNQ
ncbi:hypothetical protein ACVXZY_06430 [Staphylococcus aureus]